MQTKQTDRRISSMNKKIVIVALLLASGLAAFAKTPAYIDIELGGGAMMMPYGTNDYGRFSGGSFDLGAKYSLLFHPRKGWGANFGVNFSTFQGTKVLNAHLESAAIDDKGRTYTLFADIKNWTERQQQYSISIPINIFYQKQRPRHSGWFTSFGVKLYLPLYTGYKVTQGDLITKGWYEQWGGTMFEQLPQHGFGQFNTLLPSGENQANFLLTGQVMFGAILRLDKKNEMYVALYAEHGFYDMYINKDAKPLFTTIESLDSYQYNGYYSSLATRTIPIMFGLKIGWRFKDVHDCNCIRQQ